MAFIYRYEVRNKRLRKELDLQKFDQQIISVIQKLFEYRLKDTRITQNFFEFKLYESVKNTLLREMGKKLSFVFNGLEEKNNGFVRMKQEFYAIVYPNEYENRNKYYVELIDSKDINESTRIEKQAQKYIMNSKTKDDKNELNKHLDISEKTKKAFYIDVLSSDINIKEDNIITYERKEKIYFKVSGYHVKKNNNESNLELNNNFIEITNFFDVGYLEKINDSSKERSEKDKLKIIKYKKICDKEEIKKIKDLDCTINEVNNIKELDDIVKNKNLIFTIHNVGQGLATSIGNEKEKLIYFDFGMGYNAEEKNNPKIITANISPNRIIILSHIHMDHWYRLLYEINAFKCNWYIPNQDRKKVFNHKCAEVIAKGGSVNIIKNEINFSVGTILLNGKSNIKPTRGPSHEHENGISIRLEVKDEFGNDKNILISGDQRYDYMKAKYKKDLDILVASHHGGTYTWSNRKNAFKDIPIPRSEDSIIVYSYGNNNEYEHPSKESDYSKIGWKIDKKTPINGDFSIKLKLK